MAKKQSRRSISINRQLFEQAKGVAELAGEALSQLAERGIRYVLAQSKQAPPAAPPATTDSELVASCGDDGEKWAQAFARINNPAMSEDDVDTLRGWFQNAIEHAHIVRRSREEQARATEPPKELSAAEAIYGFVAWLTTRRAPTVMSAANECGDLPPLIERFCKVNHLPPPRDGWDRVLTHPPNDARVDGPPVGVRVEVAGTSAPPPAELMELDEPRVVYDEDPNR